jgi:hypothetical protein
MRITWKERPRKAILLLSNTRRDTSIEEAGHC